MNELEVFVLYDLKTVRDRAWYMYEQALMDNLTHFSVDESRLDSVAHFVSELTKKNYPSLDIPRHSRWRHFEIVKSTLFAKVSKVLDSMKPLDKLKSSVELAILSSFLDAGAGNNWQYNYSEKIYSRSEGLAVATLNMYYEGAFSCNGTSCSVDAKGLLSLDIGTFSRYFQVDKNNELIGVKKRLSLLHSIANALVSSNHSELFDGVFSDIEIEKEKEVDVQNIFKDLLMFFIPLLPESKTINNIALGDVGYHERLFANDNTECLIPFHKLIQWVTYSLIEPFAEYGVKITNEDLLTGLPEYRNGGLFSDFEVVKPKNMADIDEVWTLDSVFVVEWRALTVALLDKTRAMVSEKLGCNISMGMLLQGGTWEAGRAVAKEKRRLGDGPYHLDSNGTIF